MSDIKLFRLHGDTITELDGKSVAVEKSLQTLIERHLDTFLGVRLLATEYTTGKTHGGRLDTGEEGGSSSAKAAARGRQMGRQANRRKGPEERDPPGRIRPRRVPLSREGQGPRRGLS